MSTTITFRDNGPILVQGPITVVDAAGNQFQIPTEKPSVALCRCGQSKNKPFCDGSHASMGFHDDAMLRAAESPPPAVNMGHVEIRARANGPLMLTGPLTVIGANGRKAFAESTFLCRCGASANKPYCDGTHKRIGFTA